MDRIKAKLKYTRMRADHRNQYKDETESILGERQNKSLILPDSLQRPAQPFPDIFSFELANRESIKSHVSSRMLQPMQQSNSLMDNVIDIDTPIKVKFQFTQRQR